VGAEMCIRASRLWEWGAGVQCTRTESVCSNFDYEGSCSGDWRTDGFIGGGGYKC
ncbi:Ail/Lom family outer membrane beta-barrel protein, partial [Escherichia coli]|uniref:Ail/Lom family outer membrane beta-barrel protein n=1 Tax=Escherichia coli TaxID=562 RepID=UPI0016568B2B